MTYLAIADRALLIRQLDGLGVSCGTRADLSVRCDTILEADSL